MDRFSSLPRKPRVKKLGPLDRPDYTNLIQNRNVQKLQNPNGSVWGHKKNRDNSNPKDRVRCRNQVAVKMGGSAA